MVLECGIKVKSSELLYYMFIGSILFAKGIGLYDGQNMFKIVLIFAGLCWLGKIVLTAYTIKELVVTALILIMGVISYKVSGDKGLLLYMMMVVGSKDISLKKIFYLGMIVWTISFATLFFLTTLHVIDSPFKVHEKMGDMIIRWGLGYPHPNVLHVSYLLFCMLIGYCIAEKMNIRYLLLLMIGNIIVFIYSVSFTGVIAVTFYIILCCYLMYRRRVGILESIFVKAGALFCLLFSMFAPILLKGKLFDAVNKILNTRLYLSKLYLTNYPLSFLGKRVSVITTYSSTMDSSYVYAYVAYGVIVFMFLMVGYTITIHEYSNKGRGKELVIILACLVSGVTEPFLFNSSFKNISLLFLRDSIYRKNTKKEIWEGNKYDKSITISKMMVFNVPRKIIHNIRIKRKCIIFVTIIGVIVGISFGSKISEKPTRIIVPRSESDVDELYRTELNIDESDIVEGDLVYGQPKDGAAWMELTGRALKIEWFRNIIAIGVFTGMISFLLVNAFYFLLGRGKAYK